MSELKIVFRKTAYCIGCRVCEANCPNGYITMHDGIVCIDDKCIKCKKCHDVFHGCLVANSLKLPKGEKKMGSIDRYGNMGIEFAWVKNYFKLKDDFWNSTHGLGTNKVKYLKGFLKDSEITIKNKNEISYFGNVIDKLSIENVSAWALMLCNLVYTSEFNWWIQHIEQDVSYTPSSIYAMLDDSMSDNTRSHIISAYKNIFISNRYLGEEIGLGVCVYEIKSDKRIWKSVIRHSWHDPDPRVILYSLYKFAENCGEYYQFTLTTLLDNTIERDGISPTRIFGLDRNAMVPLLNGLSANYPDFISVTFSLGLDTIDLRPDKTSRDVLELF